MTSTRDLMNTPVTRFGESLQQHMVPARRTTDPVPHEPTETLDNIAQVTPVAVPDVINHYTVARVLDVTASVTGRDLGGVVDGINQKIASLGKLPAGMYITVRGQGDVMNQASPVSRSDSWWPSCSCTSSWSCCFSRGSIP